LKRLSLRLFEEVQTIILYNSETWTPKEGQKRKLRVFEMSVLRKICGVTRETIDEIWTH